MAVWAWNAFIASIAGNTVIWKPSSKTPLCALAVHHLCQKVLTKLQLPPVFSLIIPESRALSRQLIQDKRIPLISFTGSTESGKEVAVEVASRFGRCILELGGNNAVILDECADLNIAIPAIVFGAVGTAGQRCTSTRRVFVPKVHLENVEKRLIQAYRQIKIGNPKLLDSLMGPLIDKKAVNKYQKTIQDIKELGGKIIFGGQVMDCPGFFVQPTIVTGLDNHEPLVQRETFAPILYLISYQNLEEAICLQNQVPQGLASSLFTENFRNAEYFLSVMGSDCGIANINVGTSGAEITGAFGGEKATGGGREAGSDAWKAYMRRQTNTLNWGKSLPLAQGVNFKIDI
jgi:aldehyde dehydrogenase (NAD+)